MLFYRVFLRSNPTTDGGYNRERYRAILTCTRNGHWILTQVLSYAHDRFIKVEPNCLYTMFPVIKPEVTLTDAQRATVLNAIASVASGNAQELAISATDEVDSDGNQPWRVFVDHQDELIRLRMHASERLARRLHI